MMSVDVVNKDQYWFEKHSLSLFRVLVTAPFLNITAKSKI